ncbi:MAG: hypothetical protein OXN90_10645, partial [Gemmatimonadota bacterium]|nr:hypothetical protein [Gemmatimonadota bacterium]
AEERAARGLAPNALLSKFKTIVEDDVFLELLDWPKTFPLIWDMGLIYVSDQRRSWRTTCGVLAS